ncbi:MAG: hypothetical protein COA43_11745 [Robiginitomaculum sp.]|nr:MAG: hypothetical protein COA43_11745 [Robiginitomaculum sp.]
MSLLTILIIFNIFIMACVFGIAVCSSLIVHPSLLAVPRQSAVDMFRPFFHKSAHYQLILSLVVLGGSLLISIVSQNWWWFGGAVFLQTSGPYTLKILMPTNNRIMAEGADVNSEAMTHDLIAWGRLHAPRTIISAITLLWFLICGFSLALV